MLSSVASYGDRFYGDTDGPLSLTMSRSARRGPWLPEEDQALLQLVRTQGANNWVRISQQIQHRSPKQCRERYHQNLKPSLKHDPISAQEGEAIERLVQEMGKRWAEIARRLGNRSDNAVKNWWNGSVNRRRRNPAQTTTGFKQVGGRLQPVPFTLPSKPSYALRAIPPFESNNVPNLDSHDTRHRTMPSQDHPAVRIPSPIHISPTSMSASSSTLPFDTRILSPGQSAMGAASYMSNPRPLLHQVQTSEARPKLPPLRPSSFHLHYGDKLNSSVDRPPISPGLSDTSQRHAPSLVSDNHSIHSISPGTVITSWPGMSVPTDVRNSSWADARGTTQLNSQHQPYHHSFQPEQYTQYASRLPIDTALNRLPVSVSGDERCKDQRMNVSTLLQ